MTDNKYNKHVRAMTMTLEQYLRYQLSKDRKTDTLEDILRPFENQTQQDNDLTLTEAKQDTYATYMKDNTNITDLQKDRAVDNKINRELTNPPKKEDSKTGTDEDCNTNIQMQCSRIVKKSNRLKYQWREKEEKGQ